MLRILLPMPTSQCLCRSENSLPRLSKGSSVSRDTAITPPRVQVRSLAKQAYFGIQDESNELSLRVRGLQVKANSGQEFQERRAGF